MCVLPQLRFLRWESRAILSACFVAPGAFIFFFALIIYHFYCRYPPPIRSNERDPGHGAVTAASKQRESRSSRAVRSPLGRLSRVFSHPPGEGGSGVPPRSPPPCSRFAGQEGRGAFRRSRGTGQPCPPPSSSPGPGSGEVPAARPYLAGWAQLPSLRRGHSRVPGDGRGRRISAELRGLLSPRKEARVCTDTRQGLN